MKSKRILICDDHYIFTNGLLHLLIQANENYLVDEAHDSNTCKKLLETNKYDVFFCDLNIDSKDGFTLISEMKAYLHATRIIIISAYCENNIVKQAKNLGVQGFLKKDSNLFDITEAIESIQSFCTNVTSVGRTENKFDELDEKFQIKFRLSNQEKMILKLVFSGKTSKEIGQLLFITKTTVNTHRRNINKKFGVSGISSLYNFVYENQLLD